MQGFFFYPLKMNKLKLAILLCLITFSINFYGQVWGIDMNLSFLKDQKELNIEFLYDSMTVTGCIGADFTGRLFERTLEPDFVAQKIVKFNKRKPGNGDKWAKSWYDARTLYFEPNFEKEFKSRLKGFGINATTKNTQAKYTIIIKTTNLTFGWLDPAFSTDFLGGTAMRNQADHRMVTYADYFITIVETGNHSNLMARASVRNVYGRRVPMFSMNRFKAKLVGPCYDRAGKMLGKSAIKAMRK